MAKIKYIKKSRKECKCGKCGEIIPVGSAYVKGVMNFARDIVRCMKCGLKSYEVTTSSYKRTVGRLQEDWQSEYYNKEDRLETIENIKSELESLQDEVQESFDNIPENLQEAENGQLLQERIDGIDSVIDELDSIDCEDEEMDEDDFVTAIDDALAGMEY